MAFFINKLIYADFFKKLKKDIAKYCFIPFLFFILILHSTVAKAGSDPVLDFAKQQIEQKFYLPAISTLNTFLVNNPKDRDALYWKAYCFYKIDNYIAAEENYLLVLKIDANYGAAYTDMANMYVKQKKYAEALPYFNAAVKLNDTLTDLFNSRGMCYYYADKFELAIKDFKRVIKMDPNNYVAYNNMGSANYNNQNIATASMKDLLLAQNDFNKSIEIKPDFEMAYRNRGIVLFYMDSLDKSYKDLLYASQLDPKDENAHYYLGKLLFKQKNYLVAMQFYDVAIKLVKYRADIYIDRGVCKIELENFKSARNDFYLALQLTNNKGIIYYNFARLEAAEGNKIESFQQLRNAKKAGLFFDVKYFTYIANDIYYKAWEKDKEYIALIQELKFGKK